MTHMPNIAEMLSKARECGDPNEFIEYIPYAKMLGVRVDKERGCFHLPPKKSNIGNPTLPALHGGALGGFMEMCGIIHVMLSMDAVAVPKVVDFSIDYVRAGRYQDTFARCEIVRFGRKLVNLSVEAWQEDEAKPIAKARAQMLVD
ncbi:PaaI family thioesterase [Pseudomaricurvus alkylphenolicus]|uniref:PaaI family thioesterase n=1 Tax=Pseudomaricurvus alkylphenolicus TaxID=1306991 RepID=UPI001F0CF498|nr:PaaI family thioesterase [Pseudomaricurvus alkylphenolicus]